MERAGVGGGGHDFWRLVWPGAWERAGRGA